MVNASVLIIGSGGREHALGWKLSQSPKVSNLFFAPGNGGTEKIGTNVSINILNNEEVVKFVKEKKIDFVVVAPDDPLAHGLVDSLEKSQIPSFGPVKNAAQIEWSKAFAKKVMKDAKIPTASYEVFSDYKKAIEYVLTKKFPLVIKASGLALGKGVTICQSLEQSKKALEDAMVKKVFGEAGSEVVIEEFLEGKEISIHAFCDGKDAILFPVSKDHKQIFDGNRGPNTGGMGTIAPVAFVSDNMLDKIKKTIVLPLLQQLKKMGILYKGILYPGIIITQEGPKVLEFNARFGDPETQSYMRLLDSDLFEIMLSCYEGTLDTLKIVWKKQFAATIVIASAGYPESSQKGIEITGIDDAEKENDVVVFHAGTKFENNKFVTNGGRVLGVSAIGNTLDEALEKAYKGVRKIKFDGMQYRTDIGKVV